MLLRKKYKEFSVSELIEFALLGFGIILLITTLHPKIQSDGYYRFVFVEQVLQGQAISFVKYSIVQPILSLPLAYLAKLVGWEIANTVAYFNLIVFLTLGSVIYFRLKAIYSLRASNLTFLLLIGASMLPVHLQEYFGEVLSAFAICAGLLLLNKKRFWAVILVAIGIANTPVLIIPTTVAAIVLIKKYPALLIAIAVAVVIFLLENYFKTGSLLLNNAYLSKGERGAQTLLPYSGMPGFSYPLFFGLLSVLLSFGKGIFFFIPGVLLFFNQPSRALLQLDSKQLLGLMLAGFVLIAVYAKWWAWYGGVFWGPRFFLILIIPATLLLALKLLNIQSKAELFWTTVLTVLSVWVAIEGVIFNQNNMDVCASRKLYFESFCWYVPEYSALWRPFSALSFKAFIFELINHQRAGYAFWALLLGLYLVLNSWMTLSQKSWRGLKFTYLQFNFYKKTAVALVLLLLIAFGRWAVLIDQAEAYPKPQQYSVEDFKSLELSFFHLQKNQTPPLMQVAIENKSKQNFYVKNSKYAPIALSWRYVDALGKPISEWNTRKYLSDDLGVMAKQVEEFELNPDTMVKGGYLQVSLVQEGVFWLHDIGVAPLDIKWD